MKHRELFIADAAGTLELGRTLGKSAQAGDVICLYGDLGTGKTTFTQGYARGLGIDPAIAITSPTFTIVSEHHEGRFPLYHLDVYRLSGPDDLYDLGFDSYLDGDGVVIIEWADKILEALPGDRLDVEITISGSGRAVALRSHGPSADRLVDALGQL